VACGAGALTAVRMLDATTGELAERLGAELLGPSDLRIAKVEAMDRADGASLTFIRDAAYADRWSSCAAAAAVVTRGVTPAGHTPETRALLVVDDADRAMIRLLELVTPAHAAPAEGVHEGAYVDPSARLGEGVRLGPGVVVGPGASVGAGAVLHAGVVLGAGVEVGPESDLRAGVVVEDRCVVGGRVIIHPNAVIGADGFGYRPSEDGRSVVKIPHAGWVEIGDGVEIGACTTVDRGKFGATVVGAGTKIDNQVQIGHNCRIGRGCVICGAVGIAGSVTVGDGVTLGGGVRVRDNITIGSGASVAGASAVGRNVPAGETWMGVPARKAETARRDMMAGLGLSETLRDLRKRVKALERSAT